MKTPDDFKYAAMNKGITGWNIKNCRICGKSQGYIFRNHFEDVYCSESCDCIGMKYYPARKSDWNEVCRHYNFQVSPEYKKEMDKFWSFKDNDGVN